MEGTFYQGVFGFDISMNVIVCNPYKQAIIPNPEIRASIIAKLQRPDFLPVILHA
jgi:hypothetical protein